MTSRRNSNPRASSTRRARSLSAAWWRKGSSPRSMMRPRDQAGESGGEAPTAEVGVGAHRADLPEPRWGEALSGHRHERVPVVHADVPAELHRADRERAGAGELHQRQHLPDGRRRRARGHARTVGRSATRLARASIWLSRRLRPGLRPARRGDGGGSGRSSAPGAVADEGGQVAPGGVGVDVIGDQAAKTRDARGRSAPPRPDPVGELAGGRRASASTALSSTDGSAGRGHRR